MSFKDKTLWVYSQHIIFFVFYKLSQSTKVFVIGKPFQLSLTFAGKTGACSIEEPSRCAPL